MLKGKAVYLNNNITDLDRLEEWAHSSGPTEAELTGQGR